MPLITILPSIGCEGREIAELVARELGIDLYDDRRLAEEGASMGRHSDALKEFDEKAPGLFERLISHWPEIYLDLLQSVVYQVARKGEGVILGHGSPALLRDFGCALHVRVHASLPWRVEQLRKERSLDRGAAEKMVHENDSGRRAFFRFAFHLDWSDPSLYDLFINRDKLSVPLAARLITDTARSPEIVTCSVDALARMEGLALARRVEAAILDNRLHLHGIAVDVPERGVVRLSGVVYEGETKHRLMEVAAEVPGVSKVRSELAVLPPVSAW